jgi:predicted XRE-type DNA-binding protein
VAERGKEVKLEMIRRNLTTKELSKAIGVTRSRVSHCINSDVIFKKIEEYFSKLDNTNHQS